MVNKYFKAELKKFNIIKKTYINVKGEGEMKIKKILLFIFVFVLIIFLNLTEVNAFMPRVVYNPINVFISNIMRYIPIILMVGYIIGSIIYWAKSKKDKKQKRTKLVICFVIIAIIATISYCCADIVMEAGAIYSSNPNLKKIIKDF